MRTADRPRNPTPPTDRLTPDAFGPADDTDEEPPATRALEPREPWKVTRAPAWLPVGSLESFEYVDAGGGSAVTAEDVVVHDTLSLSAAPP